VGIALKRLSRFRLLCFDPIKNFPNPLSHSSSLLERMDTFSFERVESMEGMEGMEG
jgi:hypothetical protein